jgi:hypothetical protein
MSHDVVGVESDSQARINNRLSFCLGPEHRLILLCAAWLLGATDGDDGDDAIEAEVDI